MSASFPYVNDMPPIHASVIHMLADSARRRPDAIAIIFEGTRSTYRETVVVVAALARRWSCWVRPGDRVALVMQNSFDLAVAVYAVHALRAQVVALNPVYSTRELKAMVEDAAPALLIHDQSSRADVAACCRSLPGHRLLTTTGGASFSALAGGNDALPSDLPSHDDLATLQYTGGTTGRAKGVNISHRQLAFNLAQREALLPTRYGAETVLCVMPLFHVSAVAMSLHLACYAGSTLIIHRRFDVRMVLQTIATEHVSVFSAAPAIFFSLVSDPELVSTDFRSLRCCFSGAAPLPEAILTRWEAATHCPILEGYGMSEAGPCLTYNPAKGPRKVGSVGLPVPASELQVVDVGDVSRVLPSGSVGEIRVRGPHVMVGYRNLPEQTRAALHDGWMHTGDMASIDDEGYVFIKGRRDECINVGGYNVYPREVEDVLRSHPDVDDAAVFGVPHPRSGQVVQAWVVLRLATPSPPIAALIEHCAGQLARYKVPCAIGLTNFLPKTSVGKLARRNLQPISTRNTNRNQAS